MGQAKDRNTTSTQVQTYIPTHQKTEWEAHAEEFEMSLSEFIRSMVQAGRSDFPVEGFDTDAPADRNSDPGEDSAANPQGQDLEERVVDILSASDCLDWDELVAALSDDLEERLEHALQALQREDRIRYSGREGGYLLE
jgi:hypothetical protein